MRSAQAALPGGYLERWLSRAMRAAGRGCLALAREECCSFGAQLAAKLLAALAQEKVARAKDAAEKAKEGALGGKALLEEWVAACKGNERLQGRQEKKKVLAALAEEAASARLRGGCRAKHEASAARGSKGSPLRSAAGELGAYARKK